MKKIKSEQGTKRQIDLGEEGVNYIKSQLNSITNKPDFVVPAKNNTSRPLHEIQYCTYW